MMKKVVLTLVVMLLAASVALANQEPAPAPVPATAEERIVALEARLAKVEAATPKKEFSIGMMPIEGAGKIPQVGNAFRQILVSALNEAGTQATESLDEETLHWVQRQDQLVRERWIDSVSAPKRGELQGVSHYLLATVTRYGEADVEKDIVIFGIFKVMIGGHGKRIRTGSLVVDFRLIDAESGKVVDAFRTEAAVQQKMSSGLVFVYFVGLGWQECKGPLPEAAARNCAQQAAAQITLTAERLLGVKPQLPPRPPTAETQKAKPEPPKPEPAKK